MQVPATEGQQEGRQRHRAENAARDGNCNQQRPRGTGFQLALLHTASSHVHNDATVTEDTRLCEVYFW